MGICVLRNQLGTWIFDADAAVLTLADQGLGLGLLLGCVADCPLSVTERLSVGACAGRLTVGQEEAEVGAPGAPGRAGVAEGQVVALRVHHTDRPRVLHVLVNRHRNAATELVLQKYKAQLE